ncbi:hypothetical protein F4553_007419 [Allocatelliglobosispora scoriae]|uniref:Uncharacterized protein n=1 Tax=Allocatelliglobosispora scoriae TaxID=643052 RepID=A0A841C235_9ACTN|nr:hypothetical protein [Allocatelliglobosispora scoriae]MBB5873985.1 hypothetical protein [Allocatelliglobosispora scoriae]
MGPDVLMMHFPPELAMDRPPPGWRPRPIGTGAEIRATFARTLPGCHYRDGELHYSGDGFTISAFVDEFDDQPVLGLTIVITRDGGDPLPTTLALTAALDAGATMSTARG